MFKGLSELESVEPADICIIGAGAAGITLALQLKGLGKRVLLMESGGLEYGPDTQKLNEGRNSGLKYPPLGSTRLRFFGGTTNHWAGQSTPLDEIDFETRSWVPNSGWPIDYKEFSQYLDGASEVCKLTTDTFSNEEWSKRTGDMFETPGIETCIFGYPSPITRFGQAYRDEIENASDIECILFANAVSLNCNELTGELNSVEFKSLEGVSKLVRANKFILACGALQNIKLLLNSVSSGINNSNDLIGAFFMEHPNYSVGEVEIDIGEVNPRLIKPRELSNGIDTRIDFKLTASEQKRLGVLNHTAFLFEKAKRATSNSWKGKMNSFLNRVESKVESITKSKVYAFKFRLEHAPSKQNRVSLSDSVDELQMQQLDLNLSFGDLEEKTLALVMSEFARHFAANHLGKVNVSAIPKKGWENKVGWQYHHFGGTRMSVSPEEGVVDTNLRCHHHPNLYIASTSTFPTGGHANPTLNLVAMTLRLAEHLKKEIQA